MSGGCPHPVIYQGLCAACGSDVSALPAAKPASANASSSNRGVSSGSHAIVLGGHHKTIHLSSDELAQRTRANTIEIINRRKMICVLDLDHTLLHATSDARIGGFIGRESDLHQFTLGPKTHYVKMRPGLQSFLEEVANLFDLHVYTMGARAYADAVVPLFDPSHRFVKHRIVSRDESSNPGSELHPTQVAKSLKRMYPCDEGIIAILDDRTDVWAGNAKNVVRAFEYLYFSGRGEMNSRPDQHATPDAALPIFPYQLSTHPYPDNVLASVTSVFQAIHRLFYRQVDQSLQPPTPDQKPFPTSDLYPLSADMSIPRLITLIKKTTLDGCVLVFSGVFPTVKGRPTAHTSEAWIQATAYGARCLEDFPGREAKENPDDDDCIVPFGTSVIDAPPRVTHVVAARDGSAKLHYASSLPVDTRPHLVHVSWLWHSLAHFQKGDEKLFPLWSDKSAQPKEPTTATGAEQSTDITPQQATTDESNKQNKTETEADGSSATQSTSNAAPVAPAPDAAPVSTPAPAPASDVIDLTAASAPAASAPVPSSSMVTATIGGLRRRIPKKSQPVDLVSAPAAAPAAAATLTAATPAKPTAANADAANARYALHLVHHAARPVSADELVVRVHSYLSNQADSARAQSALADLTAAREMVKSREFTSRRRSSLSTPVARSRKSVTFSEHELGPTNPNYDRDAHTMSDHENHPLTISNSLKRKAQVPLDDVDRIHKEPRSTPSALPSAASDTSSSDDDFDLDDIDDVLDLSSEDGNGDGNAVTTEELYRDPDVLPADEQTNEPDPFDIGDDCFDDEMEYGDDAAHDDDN